MCPKRERVDELTTKIVDFDCSTGVLSCTCREDTIVRLEPGQRMTLLIDSEVKDGLPDLLIVHEHVDTLVFVGIR